MADVLQTLGERIKAIGGSWAAYTAVGSFVLYVFGYLALRFHLTALGIGTDLAVLDERYLFAGARFLVYLVATVPGIVLLGLLLLAVLWLPYRLLPAAWRANLSQQPAAWASTNPGRVLLAGILFSLFLIQFVMKDCFELSNLLLRPSLPEMTLSAWLLREDEGRIALYFTGLIAACAVPVAVLIAVQGPGLTRSIAAARHLLVVLFALQVLLLPVNYGYLVLDNTLPRVATLDGTTPLPAGSSAWLVWEGKDSMTFLVRAQQAGQKTRSLVTLARAEVKRVEILAYERIFPTLFAAPEQRP